MTPCNRIHMERLLLKEMECKKREGDQPPGTGKAEEKRGGEGGGRDGGRKRQEQIEKEVGRTLLKGNVVDVHRSCSY